ncbi:MAG: hypothetical protein WD100_05500 [Tistlia sp.]
MAAVPFLEIRLEGGAPADAPWVEGHFPGRPIVPGAVLLAYAARALAEAGFALVAIRRLKFLKPLPPGRTFTVQVRPRPEGAEILWRDGETTLAQASVTLSTDGN